VYKLLILYGILLLDPAIILAQEILPRGYFSKDTIQIGEHVNFTLILDYPRQMEVLFPDSSYDYSPFEFVGKSYLSTISNETISNDSVVFKLTTFNLDSIQKLMIPVFLITQGDSIRIDSNPDSLWLQLLITENIDSLNVQETINYQKVSKAFNYPYLLIGLGLLLLIAILVGVFFGKKIKSRFNLYRLKRAHLKFLEKFKLLQNEGFETSKKVEHLLGFWKAYLERLDGLPYTKLTTKEIVTINQNKEFQETLRSIDSSIYGEFSHADMNSLVTQLMEFGIDRYGQKIDDIKHV